MPLLGGHSSQKHQPCSLSPFRLLPPLWGRQACPLTGALGCVNTKVKGEQTSPLVRLQAGWDPCPAPNTDASEALQGSVGAGRPSWEPPGALGLHEQGSATGFQETLSTGNSTVQGRGYVLRTCSVLFVPQAGLIEPPRPQEEPHLGLELDGPQLALP